MSPRFSRATLIALLRSPHFPFASDAGEVTRESVSALDRALSTARYLGDLERLEASRASGGTGARAPAMDAALATARALAPLTEPHPASQQIGCLLAFWSAHARPIADDDPLASRERRARAAIAEMLPSLAAVHAAHDDPAWTIDDLGIAVRRWIEDQTFVPDRTPAAASTSSTIQAARYGDFDDVTIVGVVDQDWPERPRRNIFYPPALLKSLGWPSEKDRRGGGRCAFLDLLTSACAADAASRRSRSTRTRSSRGRCSSTRFRARGSRPSRASRRARARVRRRGAVARSGHARAVARRRARVGRDCGRSGRRPTRRSSTARCTTSRRAPGRSARSRPISTARSSSSRSTC